VGWNNMPWRSSRRIQEKVTNMRLYYSTNLNPRVAVAVARYLEVPVEFVRASPRDPKNEDAFRHINPNALVPVLVEGNRTLWETDAIACRLAMLASSDFWLAGDQAPEFQMWVSWSTHHFTRAASVFYWEYIIKPKLGLGSASESAIREATGEFHRYAAVLDNALSERTWLVGEMPSYADFRVATALPFAEESKLPWQGYGNIRKWHDRLWQLPAWSNPFNGLA
jgi:glutathione S-transferase